MGVKGNRLGLLAMSQNFPAWINGLKPSAGAAQTHGRIRKYSRFVPVENLVDIRLARRARVGSGAGPGAGAGGGKGARRPVSRVLSAPALSLRRARDGHSSGTRLAARLARPTRATGRECPCDSLADRSAGLAGRPYSVLLPVGFTLPPLLPGARCALAAPFHPCRRGTSPCAGGLFSVALSLGSPPPAVSRHRIPVEPGLSSNT